MLLLLLRDAICDNIIVWRGLWRQRSHFSINVNLQPNNRVHALQMKYMYHIYTHISIRRKPNERSSTLEPYYAYTLFWMRSDFRYVNSTEKKERKNNQWKRFSVRFFLACMRFVRARDFSSLSFKCEWSARLTKNIIIDRKMNAIRNWSII